MNRFLLWLMAVLAGGCAVGPEPTRLQRDELAPAGVLRVAVFTGNPLFGSPDALRATPSGPTALIGKELAVHAGVLSRTIEYTSVATMVADAKAGAWDVAAVTCEPAQAGELDYTPPYLAVGERGKPVAELCLVLPKGRSAARDYVDGFVLRAKSQGTIARAIEQSGLRGVYVAP